MEPKPKSRRGTFLVREKGKHYIFGGGLWKGGKKVPPIRREKRGWANKGHQNKWKNSAEEFS